MLFAGAVTALSLSAGAAAYGALAGRRAEERWPRIGRITETARGPVHVIERGRADGPPIVLVHGAASNARDMLFALEKALGAHARLIAMDRPGFGYTPGFPDRERLAGHAAAVAAVIEAEGLVAPIVVGHSYGGAVALRLALDFPDAAVGLVLLGAPSCGHVGPVAAYHGVTSTPIVGLAFSHMAAPIIGRARLTSAIEAVFAPQPAPEGYVATAGPELFLRPASFAANSCDLSVVNAELAAQQERYPNIHIPVAMIAGDRDKSVSTEHHSVQLAAVIPDTRLAILPGVGHMPHYANPELAAEHALALMER